MGKFLQSNIIYWISIKKINQGEPVKVIPGSENLPDHVKMDLLS